MDRAKKLVISVIVSLSLASFIGVMAQTQTDVQKPRQRTTATPDQDKENTARPAQDPANTTPADRIEPDDTRPRPSDVPQETEANRQEQLTEEAAIVPYYNNFFTTYRL